jgi:hypothetical protein
MTPEVLALALSLGGISWMAGLLLTLMDISWSFKWTWPPVQVRVGRRRKSTWERVMNEYIW